MRVEWSLRGRIALALSFALLIVTIGLAQQQAPAPAGQGAAPAGGGRGGGNFATRFTGKVEVGSVEGMSQSRIRFEAGARTNWHVHTAGQLLLVEEGKGRLYEQGAGKIVEIAAGQPVYTKPNVPHWHGAAPDQHALQFSVYSGQLTWQEAVSDEEYLGKKLR